MLRLSDEPRTAINLSKNVTSAFALLCPLAGTRLPVELSTNDWLFDPSTAWRCFERETIIPRPSVTVKYSLTLFVLSATIAHLSYISKVYALFWREVDRSVYLPHVHPMYTMYKKCTGAVHPM